MKLSRTNWNNYVTRLSAINKTAGRKMLAYIEKHGTEDVDALVEYAYALATKYGEAASAVACEMYDEIATVQNAHVPPAVPKQPQNIRYVGAAVRGALSRAPSTVPSTVSELVKRTGAETTLKNAKRDGAYFAWVPNGDTCAFCITLASNGWRKASKKTINGDHAEHIHKNCDCEFAISFNGPGEIEGYDPDKYLAMYEGAEGSSWKDKVNSMRRAHYAANKDAINAQKRAAYAKKTGNAGSGQKSGGATPLLRLTQIAASTILEKVRNGEYKLKLGLQQYRKHVSGTKEYMVYEAARKKKGLGPQSKLTISYEEAQKIIEEKSGTGIIKCRRDGTPTNVEWITCDKIIGQYCDNGQFYDTKKAMIIHGKKGSHIVPQKGNKYD